jgi:hypothetical protein
LSDGAASIHNRVLCHGHARMDEAGTGSWLDKSPALLALYLGVGPVSGTGVPGPVMNEEDEAALSEGQAEMMKINLLEMRKGIEKLNK